MGLTRTDGRTSAFYSWNEWYMHTKYGNELNQATDTVINGATGILMVEKMAAWILLAFAAFACFYIGEEFQTVRFAIRYL